MFNRPPPTRTANSSQLHTGRSCLVSAGTDPQDDLADVGAALHEPMSFRRLRQWKGRVDDRSHLSTLNERPHLAMHRAHNGALLFHAPRAKGGTSDGNSPLHDR